MPIVTAFESERLFIAISMYGHAEARALLVDADLTRYDGSRIVADRLRGQGFEELDAEDALARDVGRISDPNRLAAMDAARSQDVRAFEPLRLLFGARVRAYAGLEP